MIERVAGLARLIATLLAIVAAFVAIPNVNVALVLVVLGLVAGLRYSGDDVARLFLVLLVLPLVGTALATIPAIGSQLNAAALNIALAAGGAAATVIALRLFGNSKSDVAGLTGKSSGNTAAATAG